MENEKALLETEEALLILAAQADTIQRLLIEKGIITAEEYDKTEEEVSKRSAERIDFCERQLKIIEIGEKTEITAEDEAFVRETYEKYMPECEDVGATIETLKFRAMRNKTMDRLNDVPGFDFLKLL